MKTKNNTTH